MQTQKPLERKLNSASDGVMKSKSFHKTNKVIFVQTSKY